MDAEKILTLISMIIAGLLTLLFLSDLAVGIPFERQIVLDVLFLLAGGFILWQGYETYRELA